MKLEYPGGIFLTETASGFRLRFSEVDVRVGINGSRLVVEVANDSSLVAERRGLCGDLDGVLRTPEGLCHTRGTLSHQMKIL